MFLAIQPSLDNLRLGAVAFSVVKVAGLVATAVTVSRFVLPPLFRHVARLPGTGAGWRVGLVPFPWVRWPPPWDCPAMGALVAGVALSTFPYALDVTAKVTSLRDFFVTLFFVGLGVDLHAHRSDVGAGPGLCVLRHCQPFSRRCFPPLYFLGSGLRLSLLNSVNLCQLSEFSLVLIALGVKEQHLKHVDTGAISLALVILAMLSSFVMVRSDGFVAAPSVLQTVDPRSGRRRRSGPANNWPRPGDTGPPAFCSSDSSARSSLLEELQQHAPNLLPEVAVVDFNPLALNELKRRGIKGLLPAISASATP